MTSVQPVWKFVTNLGDVGYLDHGGYFIYEDTTGQYPPEAEWLEMPEEYEQDCKKCNGVGQLPIDCDDAEFSDCPKCSGTGISQKANYTVYRFVLEPCTYTNGILSDNPFHPDHPAWFAHPEDRRKERPQDRTYLNDLAGFANDLPWGQDVEELVRLFISNNPVERADAWRAVGEYHGWENLDSYPLRLTRKEVEERYKHKNGVLS